jgi:micrococcal nuclease
MRKLVKTVVALAFIFTAALSAPASGAPAPSSPTGETVNASVSRIVDGDTIRILIPGSQKDVSVRLIGIDTPESRMNDRANLQANEEGRDVDAIIAMGKRAAEKMESLVRKGDSVVLEFDVGRKDRYGRVLAYVWKDGKMLNAIMVEAGYASLLTIPPNVKYADLFRELYRTAREEGRGLWAE